MSVCACALEQEVPINVWDDELRRRKMCPRGADMLLVALLVSVTSVALSNVIDTKHPFEFKPPSDSEGSLFGYSLALTNKTLYVGAPTHDVQGAVFKCDIKEQQVQQYSLRQVRI